MIIKSMPSSKWTIFITSLCIFDCFDNRNIMPHVIFSTSLQMKTVPSNQAWLGIKGLLSLYEAAHLSVHGEAILDDALSFTTTCLTRSTAGARTYISFYQDMDEKNLSLEKLAKHDFNLVKSWHRKELSNISKWWKHMNVSSSLPFVRDRLVECYFWIVGVYFEPCYSLARIFMTKVMILTSIIDDFYDVYGTLEELQLFADALERWDITEINQLPEYMKVCYRAVLNVYNEMEELMRHELGAPTSNNRRSSSYHIQYAKEGWRRPSGPLVRMGRIEQGRRFWVYCVDRKLMRSYDPRFDWDYLFAYPFVFRSIQLYPGGEPLEAFIHRIGGKFVLGHCYLVQASARTKQQGPASALHFHYGALHFWLTKFGEFQMENFKEFVDHLLCIIPFEIETCRLYGLESTFAGHPIVEDALDLNTALGMNLGDSSIPSELMEQGDEEFRRKYGTSSDVDASGDVHGSYSEAGARLY
ncbi:hypothetical protein Sjap_002973 [Stephania japonica]|uniref:Uncharacterized protein n=1 Tax=Stephania japonica TaxID=461633 RepID=A0AAP0KPD8_9MAGN